MLSGFLFALRERVEADVVFGIVDVYLNLIGRVRIDRIQSNQSLRGALIQLP